jgi:transposase
VQGEKDSLVNNVNKHMGPAPVPSVLLSVGRMEPERSEGDRSATDSKTGAAPKTRPDPEVVVQAKRRRFTAEYKQRILADADRAKGSGGVGALLRREGLYSSLLTTWRRERDAVVLQALAPQKRGPKAKRDPVAEENQQLRRETLQLKEALRKADIVIDIQKKVAALLGRPILTAEPEEKA